MEEVLLMNYEKFTNLYQLQKTLRFKLIPQGKTLENFNNNHIIDSDVKKDELYPKVKELFDNEHKKFIEAALKGKKLENLGKYYEEYNKPKEKRDSMDIIIGNLRKEIGGFLKGGESKKAKDMLKSLQADETLSGADKEAVNEFANFTTYFENYKANRKNMYTTEGKTTEIAYRLIDQNLPKFIDNMKIGKKIFENISKDQIEELQRNMYSKFSVDIREIFELDFYNNLLTQKGIDIYNQIIGGINEYINKFNQDNKNAKIPFLKILYKQILSDKSTVSSLPEKFENDKKLTEEISEFYCDKEKDIKELIGLLKNIKEYNATGLFVTAGAAVTNLSKKVFGSWSVINAKLEADYEEGSPYPEGGNEKKIETYNKKKKEYFKKIKSYSIEQLQKASEYADDEHKANKICEYIKSEAEKLEEDICKEFKKFNAVAEKERHEDDKHKFSTEETDTIKSFLDSIKELQEFAKMLIGSGEENDKDELFYGEFDEKYNSVKDIIKLYDKARNYMTEKPYSQEKIKLNFQNPQLLGGWDMNKESDYRSVLLKRGDKYYLAIMDKSNSKVFENMPTYSEGDFYEKIDYKLLPDPSKMLPKVFFANSNIEYYNPNKKILEIKNSGTFKKGDAFNIDDCHTFIDFYKDSINRHSDWVNFNFTFTETQKYKDISEFYKEVADQGYSIKMRKISKIYIDEMIESGAIYLFQIYNKDFSNYSHGKPNLHTMYFKALFEEQNLADVVYKLNGQAEMFYRKASVKYDENVMKYGHHYEQLKDKFSYPIIKDRRYTADQFMLHVPITLNFKSASNVRINESVRTELKNSGNDFNIIGIDRGERNLIYICLIGSDGKIKAQKSLNEIIDSYQTRDGETKVKAKDYHELLDAREKENDKNRKSWKTIEGIKELKEGYISRVVHEVCKMAIENNAIIVMEDLNGGFKNSRKKVEKQVYQKFEKMLIDKLNYYVDKQKASDEPGGLYRAYQLTEKFESFTKMGMQNGIMFYIPAASTSKIDPVTGFVNLLYPKYQKVEVSQEFFGNFDSIRYNAEKDYFEFETDYSKFQRCEADFRKKWTVCTFGDRIETFRNKDKNSEWDTRTISLTKEFKELFKNQGIDISKTNIKDEILKQNDAKFFKELTHLLSLTLQMRNSVPNSVKPEDDYIISPVSDEHGRFYDSRLAEKSLPQDADANGAYNIARKGLWAVKGLQKADDVKKAKLACNKAEWLEFVQKK